MNAPRLAALAAALTVGLVAAPAAAAEQCTAEAPVLVDQTPYALTRLGARRLWERATGRGVVVAVVDSGVDVRNPHLGTAVVVSGTSLVPGDTDRRGWTDATGHGTAIAGMIAARHVKGSGVMGLSPQARILPVRVFVSESPGDVHAGAGPRADRMAAGIRWAVGHGADVVNVSMSTPRRDAKLDAAVAYARTRGVLVVASAGNRGQGTDKSDGPRYPAASDGALAVTAATVDDLVTDDSVHGPHVDVAAPGQNVLTTFHSAGDCLLETEGASTSFATGYVSAAAALLAEAYPRAGGDEIAYRLTASADRPVRSRRDDVRGWGLIQPEEALSMTVDGRRAGPPPPGRQARPAAMPKQQVLKIDPPGDPLDGSRRAAAWWLFAGTSGTTSVLLLSRWVAR